MINKEKVVNIAKNTTFLAQLKVELAILTAFLVEKNLINDNCSVFVQWAFV